MSRIGKKPVPIPAGVEVKVAGKNVSIKGPKGTLTQELNGAINASKSTPPPRKCACSEVQICAPIAPSMGSTAP